ncbi:MAG: type VII toxin-antitoxin system HepT family RNase toxin [Sulfuricurvum sp.]
MEILEKLKGLSDNLIILESIKEELDGGVIGKRTEWEVRYGLFESIQIVIDIACKVTSYYNLAHPKSYGECISALVNSRYIDSKIAEKTTRMIGLRNLLVHEYATIDTVKLIDFLEYLDDFREFARQIQKSVN